MKQESLGELAYKAIRTSIVEGRFRPGARLVETQLAADLGISRGPLREALTRLADEGLLEQKPRRGTFVRRLEGDDIVDLYNFRLAIETAATRLAIRSRAPFDELEVFIDEMKQAAKLNDLARVVDSEFRFHEKLCELSGNQYLVESLRSLSAQLQVALRLDNQAFNDLPDVAREHVALLAVLQGGDEVEAVAALGFHIRSTIGAVLQTWRISSDRLLPDLSELGGSRSP